MLPFFIFIVYILLQVYDDSLVTHFYYDYASHSGSSTLIPLLRVVFILDIYDINLIQIKYLTLLLIPKS